MRVSWEVRVLAIVMGVGAAAGILIGWWQDGGDT